MAITNLTQADLDAIEKRLDGLVQKRVAEAVRPVAQRVDKHSFIHRELLPTVHGLRDSQHDIEDRSMGFERMMMTAVGRIEERVDEVVKSIPPTAKAASGAEDAAVAGAKAAIQGANAAIDSKTNSLAAKVATHRALIGQILTAIALAAWQIYEHFVRVTP